MVFPLGITPSEKGGDCQGHTRCEEQWSGAIWKGRRAQDPGGAARWVDGLGPRAAPHEPSTAHAGEATALT